MRGLRIEPRHRNPFTHQEWSAEYEGHDIRVTNQLDASDRAKLYIDGELRDEEEEMMVISYPEEILLSTELADTGDRVDVRFKATLFTVKAKILVNNKRIGGDIFENSPINEKVDSSHPEVLKHGLLTKLLGMLFSTSQSRVWAGFSYWWYFIHGSNPPANGDRLPNAQELWDHEQPCP